MANIEIFGTLVRNDDNTNRDKIVQGSQVEGGYFVCASVPTSGTWQTGQLCYCTGDSKFYQYNGSSWQEKEFGTNSIATSSALGLVKSSTTGTTANRDYNVQVKSDGTMKVNVPWTDTNTDTNTTYTLATGDSNGQIKVTPSSGNAYNVSVKGLGSAAYTASTAYAAASHGTHVSYGGNGSATTVSRSDHTHNYLSTSGGTVSGNLAVTGTTSSTGLITQGSPSSDSTITSMNRFAADLFVSGNGSAPNNPKVAGFYLGKSTTDENRHMDIVSGADYSYIDFNKASNVVDYQARCLVNVSTGNVAWQWDSGATDKTFNVAGTIKQNGTNVSLEGHTHSGYVTTDTKNTTGTTNTTSKIYLAGATSQAANPVTYSNVNCYASGGYLYSGGTKVSVEGHTHSYATTDTKNTAGASDTDSKIYLVGASSQATNAVTYSHAEVFVDASHYVNATGFKASSDRRLKENIKEFKTEKSILDLPVVEFDFKESGVHQIGCIAQDLQEICPEIVSDDENGYLSIQENKIVYLLLQEVKKLKSEVELLKQKNN